MPRHLRRDIATGDGRPLAQHLSVRLGVRGAAGEEEDSQANECKLPEAHETFLPYWICFGDTGTAWFPQVLRIYVSTAATSSGVSVLRKECIEPCPYSTVSMIGDGSSRVTIGLPFRR